MMPDFLDKEYYHNSLHTWVAALGAVAAIIIMLRLIKLVTVTRLRNVAPHTDTLVDDIVLEVGERTSTFFQIAMGMAAATYILDLPDHWDRRIRTAVVLVSIIQSGVWGTGLVHHAIYGLVDRRGEPGDVAHQTGKNMLRFLALAVVWATVILLCMDNLGINVTALIAGLGVTGVAVALATQNIVGDLFASVSILLDKPFFVGDFIIVDTFIGTVERIGIKTTRLRSLGGEYLIMANSDLSKSRVRNYKNMQDRRLLFSFQVRYETPFEQVKQIERLVREVIQAIPQTRFDRCKLLSLGESGLQYETVYYVLSPDYNLYMEIQQKINFGILEAFAARQIGFAYRVQVMLDGGKVVAQTLS